MATRLVIIGGGPAGNTAATHAARLGAQVTVVERDIVGGAAHLWDCIPSKTMIATGGAMAFTQRLAGMGVTMTAPFMTLSFLALSVIPELKITDRGLVDVARFELVPLGIE